MLPLDPQNLKYLVQSGTFQKKFADLCYRPYSLDCIAYRIISELYIYTAMSPQLNWELL